MTKKSHLSATIVIDGKKYKEGALSEREAKKIPFKISTGGRSGEAPFYAFRSKTALKQWMAKRNLLDQYNRVESLISRASRRLSPKEEREIRRMQCAVVEEDTARLNAAMAKEGIKFGETEKLRKFLMEYDPLQGPIIHSAILWEHSHQGGRAIVLRGGWGFPDLGWFNFSKKASSSFVVGMGYLLLFVNTRFRGGRLLLWAYSPDYAGHPLWFNDDAASAIVI
jgi:hypothetical protein